MARPLASLSTCTAIASLVAALAASTAAADPTPTETAWKAYRQVITRTTSMIGNREARRLAGEHDLQILNVTWEDTGRYKDSCWGPNISDMTIQVRIRHPRTQRFEAFCMPVIRFANFSDKTADIAPEKFFLLSGNARGSRLRKVCLRDLLADLRVHLHDGASWKGRERSLLADRDTHVLVSAQACFLPIPQGGEAVFNPVLFNYQSYEGDPAVLTILATREGTSVTVIDNKRDAVRDGGARGQRLFYNQDGQKASFTGKRLSDHVLFGGAGGTGKGAGLSAVLLVQVPLKQKNPRRPLAWSGFSMAADGMVQAASAKGGSNVESAVIGHGELEGPFVEIDGLAVERDERYPVRVTVQFYKATSNGVVSKADVDAIAAQIRRVYDEGDYVGSLVVEGETGRPTEHDGPKTPPFFPPANPLDFWSTATEAKPLATLLGGSSLDVPFGE